MQKDPPREVEIKAEDVVKRFYCCKWIEHTEEENEEEGSRTRTERWEEGSTGQAKERDGSWLSWSPIESADSPVLCRLGRRLLLAGSPLTLLPSS